MKASRATAEVFFAAFSAMKNAEKEAFLEKVIGDRTLREEIIDLALIEKAKTVKGRPMPAKEYFGRRRGKRAA